MAIPSLQMDKKVYSVTQITLDLKNLVQDCFPSVWIQGEISNFKSYASGHYYFTLKDEKAQLSAVMFKGNNRLLKFKPEDGMKVLLHGRITIYEARGQYQMIVNRMEPDGVGALQLAFEQLKKKLQAEGLFDENQKQSLPKLPQTVGIITSMHGAAVHDMMSVLRRRFPNINILIYPVKVQGDGSAEEIEAAIRHFSESKQADVLIVGRGGGSLEDLWSFNEEVVVRAIAECSVPIISAVGHETDFSISDFVADLRAATPSAAAELCVPLKKELLNALQDLRTDLETATLRRIKEQKQTVHFMAKSIPTPRVILENWRMKVSESSHSLYQYIRTVLQDLKLRMSHQKSRIPTPETLIQKNRQICHQQKQHLNYKISQLLTKERHNLNQTQLKAELLNPKNVLKRGYTMITDSTGQVITKAAQAKTNQNIKINFHDGAKSAQILPES